MIASSQNQITGMVSWVPLFTNITSLPNQSPKYWMHFYFTATKKFSSSSSGHKWVGRKVVHDIWAYGKLQHSQLRPYYHSEFLLQIIKFVLDFLNQKADSINIFG